MGKKDEMGSSGTARKRQRLSSSGWSESSRLGQMSGNALSVSSNQEQQIETDVEEEEAVVVVVEEGGAGATKRCGNVIAFGDVATADVVVHLVEECEVGDSDEQVLHLHSEVLSKSRYFAALFSERWKGDGFDGEKKASSPSAAKFHVKISTSIHSVAAYITTLRLFYVEDLSEAISSVQSALVFLPVAAELLFDDCIGACLRFLEAVPWSKEEEKQILHLINYLQLDGASDLLARLVPSDEHAVEKMLNELVYAATHAHQNAASVKAFVARILSGHKSREIVRHVLDNAFKNGLKTVKDSVEEYSSPNVRGRHDEIEAIQRQNLHTAVVSGRHLLWLVERMIELKVAENAVLEWSEQSAFTANLKRAFMDDVWRNNVPGLPAVLLRCTCRLSNAMVSGSILVSKEVRKKMVRDWLPVLVTSKENAVSANCNKQLHQDLEEVFLKLISTLPVEDAAELLQQCLSFASRYCHHDDEANHLAVAFATWFRRASGMIQVPSQQ